MKHLVIRITLRSRILREKHDGANRYRCFSFGILSIHAVLVPPGTPFFDRRGPTSTAQCFPCFLPRPPVLLGGSPAPPSVGLALLSSILGMVDLPAQNPAHRLASGFPFEVGFGNRCWLSVVSQSVPVPHLATPSLSYIELGEHPEPLDGDKSNATDQRNETPPPSNPFCFKIGFSRFCAAPPVTGSPGRDPVRPALHVIPRLIRL